MMYSVVALILGFVLDLLFGDPAGAWHPIVLIGRLIGILEKCFRGILPKTPAGERIAGGCIWILTTAAAWGISAGLLWAAGQVSVWLQVALEAVMCWSILATRSLKTESMKVYTALKTGTLEEARYSVSMIVGRETARLDAAGVTRAAVETVAENTSDGIIAPLLFMAIGGAPLGFFYKAVNTMDSMLGYTDPPYTNIGLVPAKLDDVVNYVPARISAFLMLAAGWFLRLDVRSGWKIFLRDRYHHASPNSAQTESVCAGLLGLRLAGDAWYHGVRHHKPYIGDARRKIETEDIPRACRLLYGTAILGVILAVGIRMLILLF